MVQKSRGRLFLVGVLMICSTGLAYFVPFLWGPAVVLVLAGAYLVVWATLGHGRWCRTCKTFRVSGG
jgi:hypothetical protein